MKKYRKGTYGKKTCASMERKHAHVWKENVQVWKESMRKYGKKTWAEVVLKEGKMMKGERLEVLEEKMKTLDPDQNEVYKFG